MQLNLKIFRCIVCFLIWFWQQRLTRFFKFIYFFQLGQDHLLPEAEEIAMISSQLAARFLFSTGFHTKKVVRGPASDW